MNIKKISNPIIILFISITLSISAAADDTENTKKSSDQTIDSILGALADLSVEQAKEMMGISFTRDIRMKVCGYQRWITGNAANKSDSDTLRKYFQNTCSVVKDKTTSSALPEDLISAFREDMVRASLILATRGANIHTHLDTYTNDISSLIDESQNIVQQRLALKVATKYISLSWKGTAPQDAIEQILLEINEEFEHSHSKKAPEYISAINTAIPLLKAAEKKGSIVKNTIRLTGVAGGNYQLTYKFINSKGEVVEPNPTIDTHVAVDHMNLDTRLANHFIRIIFADTTADKKSQSRNLLIHLIAQAGCKEKCTEAASRLINRNTQDIFKDLISIINNENCKSDEMCSHLAHRTITTLNILSNLSKVENKEGAKLILSEYLANANTRMTRYWNHTWSLGTSLGISAGRSYSNSIQQPLTPNLYMPFGLFWTRGNVGAHFHVFDLGQYTNINNSEQDSTEYKDAIAPGISFFRRVRRYPMSLGLDYSYKAKQSINEFSEHQVKLFVAIDIPLFTFH